MILLWSIGVDTIRQQAIHIATGQASHSLPPPDNFKRFYDHVRNTTLKAAEDPLAVIALGWSGELGTAVFAVEHTGCEVNDV